MLNPVYQQKKVFCHQLGGEMLRHANLSMWDRLGSVFKMTERVNVFGFPNHL